jgi:hypothetical protein
MARKRWRILRPSEVECRGLRLGFRSGPSTNCSRTGDQAYLESASREGVELLRRNMIREMWVFAGALCLWIAISFGFSVQLSTQ